MTDDESTDVVCVVQEIWWWSEHTQTGGYGWADDDVAEVVCLLSER